MKTNANNPEKPDRIFKGILYACTAFFMFTVMSALNKLLTGQHDAVEIVFWRNLLAFIPCVIYLFSTRKYELLHTDMPVTLSLRVLIGTIGTALTLAAVQHLPMANATVLFFMSTLLIPVFAHFFLKEYIGLHRWVAVAIGMSGVVLVAQPSAEFTLIGVAFALGAAFVHASIQVLIRAMKTVDPFTINFYFFLMGVIGPGLLLPFVWDTPTYESAMILLAIGITGGLGQYFLTRGFQMAPVSLLGPFNYTGLIWATGFDILIWNYVPGWPVFLGGAIIIASKFYIIHRERQSAQKQN